jgi:hypothetical protein
VISHSQYFDMKTFALSQLDIPLPPALRLSFPRQRESREFADGFSQWLMD